MSDIIKEASEALEGVTPGPWKQVSYQSGTVQVLMRHWNNAKPNPMRDGSMYGYMSAHMTAYNIGWQNEIDIEREKQANARFIAWCREGVPALIARAEAAEAALARAYMAALDDAICEIDCGGCYGNCADPANCRQNDVRDIRAMPVPADLAKRVGGEP